MQATTLVFGPGVGRLNFNHTSINYDFGAAISGNGAINQVAGVTRLTGDNSGFAGTTTISGGTLSIGNGGATGSIAGNIVNNATLTFNRTGALTYGGAITGTGAVNIQGGGALTLTGQSAIGGVVTLVGSTLNLQGGAQLETSSNFNARGIAAARVSGPGSALLVGGAAMIGNTDGTQITFVVENGGEVEAGLFAIASSDITPEADVTVTGTGSLITATDVQVAINVGGNVGRLTISDGGRINSAGAWIGYDFGNATPAEVTVSDALWTVTGNMRFRTGRMEIVNGGFVGAGNLNVGADGGLADLRVADGSTLATGVFNIGVGAGAAVTTLSGGSAISVTGPMSIALNSSGSGVLNIGGAEGQAAATAGVLSAATLSFGPGDGRLNFNHTSTNYSLATQFIGQGAINQVAGVTHLTGASTGYTGLTTISGGELRVDGTLGGATSTVAVNAGGLLGGSGTVGGDVTVANGGVLAPGNSPGTLTIAGDLVLNGGSILQMEFGAADDPGNALNDLIVVGGDLRLDGTIDVTETAGGVFGDGLYRIIDYTGTLDDQGLNVGVLPAGSATVQTSIANQVNLIVSGVSGGGGGGGGGGPPPPTFSFWDGDGGTAADGQITGGSGTWSRTGAAWTSAEATANGAYTEPSFAVFAGTGGTVTVDASGGPIGATGLQFAADGYQLQGGGIALGTPEATIRVGDGTAAGTGFTAVIASELTGVTRVVKDDLGTLVLTGANTYAGGTTIAAGTLRIGDGGTSGSIQGDVANEGRLVFDRSDAVTFAGTISGSGSVRQAGTGTTVLTGANSYAGGTTIAAGTLQLGDGGTSGSIAGNVANDGTLAFNRADAVTFSGVISGAGAVRQMGAGTTALTAANTYAGGTTIAAGTLRGTAASFGSGAIQDDGALVIDQAADATFANALNGGGTFTSSARDG
ncbi:autotransporter-associated beta strand repeat-containing protein [Phenylobacterium sp.]|uniref:beta strand repeat-containing protein n=1 Tax=Phenylobacterium sp. TaxID=1871053 RepID=UPI0028123DB9|nr:autotransporter-associated beta strand repeat-containing protein [Phenylobacterium sp.]